MTSIKSMLSRATGISIGFIVLIFFVLFFQNCESVSKLQATGNGGAYEMMEFNPWQRIVLHRTECRNGTTLLASEAVRLSPEAPPGVWVHDNGTCPQFALTEFSASEVESSALQSEYIAVSDRLLTNNYRLGVTVQDGWAPLFWCRSTSGPSKEFIVLGNAARDTRLDLLQIDTNNESGIRWTWTHESAQSSISGFIFESTSSSFLLRISLDPASNMHSATVAVNGIGGGTFPASCRWDAMNLEE